MHRRTVRPDARVRCGRSITPFLLRLSLTVALIASWLLTVGRGAAMAATYCASASHCYTIVRLGVASLPYGFRGDYVLLHPRCLDIDSAAHFVTSETWLANFVGASGYWIEAGVAVGAPVQLGQPYFYWADDRPGHGYLEHDDSVNSPDLSQSYSIGIYPGKLRHEHVVRRLCWSMVRHLDVVATRLRI